MAYLKIRLRSDLCVGSGESFGNVIDSDICADASGLPYIPARRIKGCLRQAAMDLQAYSSKAAAKEYAERTERLFGEAYSDGGLLCIQDAYMDGAAEMRNWLQTSVPDALKTAAQPKNVLNLFSYVRGQTKMKDGIKVDNTLRFTRVMNHYNALEPGKECELSAPLFLESDDPDDWEFLELCCKAFRHMGSNRNRGLGNVTVTLDKRQNKEKTFTVDTSLLKTLNKDTPVCITYQVNLDAPITLQGCGEQLKEIPSRNVIGCLATQYLKNGSAEDKLFRELFLDGTVCWSALTPVIEDKVSVPTPVMLAYKKRSHVYVNRIEFAKQPNQDEQNREKLKILTGTYSVQNEDGYSVAAVDSHTVYHHRHKDEQNDSMLYMQESLDAHMVYGGTVTLPASIAEKSCQLLTQADFRFGRSRSAQYAVCSLAKTPEIRPVCKQTIPSKKGEAVYVILESDMLLVDNGLYVMDNAGIRTAIAKKLGLNADVLPEGQMDYCLFHTISGFQMQWHMQKEQLPVVVGGSMFCFVANGNPLPEIFQLGELMQEGFGQCRVITDTKMQKLTNIQKCSVQHKQLLCNAKYSNKLRTLLTVAAVRKSMMQTAQDYTQNVNTKKLDTGLIGRLRLMLDEEEDYQNLLKRVDSIKNSDESSEKQEGRGKTAKKFVTGLYGKENIQMKKLLHGNEPLLELLQKDTEAQKQVIGMWKLPMKRVLHLAYYGKEG